MFLDRFGWFAFMLPFGYGLWLAGASPDWYDAPGVVAAVFSLRESQAPGHPLALLLGHGFALLPIGSLSFRLTVGSAFFLASAAWLSFHAGTHLLVLLFGKEGRSHWGRGLVLGCVLAAAISGGACIQSIRPGFFALHLALLCAACERTLAWLLLPPVLRNTRGGGLALLCLGMAFAVFPIQSLWYLPGCVLLLFCGPRVRWQWRDLAVGTGILLVGLSSYLYLPIRGAQSRSGVAAEKAVTSVRRVLPARKSLEQTKKPVVSGKSKTQLTWQRGVLRRTVMREALPEQSFGARFLGVMSWFLSQSGLLFALLGLLGLIVAWGRLPLLALALGLWGVAAPLMRLMGPVSLGDLSLHGELLPSLFVLGWGGGVALFWLLQKTKRWVPLALALSFPLLALVPRYWSCDVERYWALRLILPASSASWSGLQCQPQKSSVSLLWSEMMEELLPRDALVLTRETQHSFLFLYRQIVERQRPDVSYVPRALFQMPGFARAHILRNVPSVRLVRLLKERDLLRILGELRRLSEVRPVCLEWFEDFPDWVAQTAYPTGILFSWDPENPVVRDVRGRAVDDEAMTEQQRRFWREAYLLLRPSLTTNRLLRDILLRTHLLHTQAYLQSGRWHAARQELQLASKLSPQSRALQPLQKRLQPHLDALVPPPRR